MGRVDPVRGARQCRYLRQASGPSTGSGPRAATAGAELVRGVRQGQCLRWGSELDVLG